MGQWVHRLSEIDLRQMTAICSNCGPVKTYRSGTRVRCAISKRAHNDRYQGDRPMRNRRRKFAADHGQCDSCGFVAVDPCQLDVDHIDGNWTNDESNWQILCANCHRLKTYRPEKYPLTQKIANQPLLPEGRRG